MEYNTTYTRIGESIILPYVCMAPTIPKYIDHVHMALHKIDDALVWNYLPFGHLRIN